MKILLLKKMLGTLAPAEKSDVLCEDALDGQAESTLVVLVCHFPLENRLYTVEPHR